MRRRGRRDPGSSPLARGLLVFAVASAIVGGIIPARAGFTRGGRRHPHPARDHPRSRGVYGIARPVGQLQSGIIPARAGFTPLLAGARRGAGDHPRSRGVYEAGQARSRRPLGSSPLARGLLTPGAQEAYAAGIIPARAGFTRPCARAHHARGDHPRSRGVYARALTASAVADGSSPLARGLRRRTHYFPLFSRIIPARAGFTSTLWELDPEHGDHPRSRGVYTERSEEDRQALGSSPLARGLPTAAERPARAHGIIPARAGFTLLPPFPYPRAWDHPRSRGVY